MDPISMHLPTPRHIGIVGCSAEGAALCYRTICLEGTHSLGPHRHPQVTLHTHALAEYVPWIECGDWRAVAQLMLSSARKLAAAGAEFLICPDNTIHQALRLVVPRSPLPWLHIAGWSRTRPRGAAFVARRDGDSLSDREQCLSGCAERPWIEWVVPELAPNEINRIIFDELVNAVFDDAARVSATRDRSPAAARSERRRARLYRDSAHDRRFEFALADARFHAVARSRGVVIARLAGARGANGACRATSRGFAHVRGIAAADCCRNPVPPRSQEHCGGNALVPSRRLCHRHARQPRLRDRPHVLYPAAR